MERCDVEKKVTDIFASVLGTKITEELYNEKLLEPQYGLKPRDLFALFHEIEESFDVKFIEEDLLVRRFDVFSDIVDSIMLKMQHTPTIVQH